MTLENNLPKFRQLVEKAQNITIVQGENPDADSLGCAVAMENILSDLGKNVFLHCAVDIPTYLRYINGWDRVEKIIPTKTDLIVVVDTSAKTLLEKSQSNFDFTKVKVAYLDHHKSNEEIEHEALVLNYPTYAAAGHLVYDIATKLGWQVNQEAARAMIYAILGDTLGLVSINTTADTVQAIADLVRGADISLSELDEKRREYGRKTLPIINYKGQLLQRIEYLLEDQLATLVIPLEEIKAYSDMYNPASLVIEELRNAEKVKITVILKVYEDKITGKLREVQNAPICNKVAESFGGGGHPFAAGFKVNRTDIDELRKEVVLTVSKELDKLK